MFCHDLRYLAAMGYTQKIKGDVILDALLGEMYSLLIAYG